MTRSLLLLLLLPVFAGSFRANASEKFNKPDYKKIEKKINDKTSRFFYPKLFLRYQNNDTTLTMEEYQLLYFGYFFQGNYNPIGTFSDYNDSIKRLYEKDMQSINDKNDVVRFTKELLKLEPFNIADINRMYRAYADLGDHANSDFYKFKLEMIAKTLFATGDGLSTTTAIHVLSVSDEYSILSLLGYEFDGSQHLTDDNYDYLKVKTNDDGITGMYFDVNQIFKGYQKMLSVKGSDSVKAKHK